jgi:hypothetical protein
VEALLCCGINRGQQHAIGLARVHASMPTLCEQILLPRAASVMETWVAASKDTAGCPRFHHEEMPQACQNGHTCGRICGHDRRLEPRGRQSPCGRGATAPRLLRHPRKGACGALRFDAGPGWRMLSGPEQIAARDALVSLAQRVTDDVRELAAVEVAAPLKNLPSHTSRCAA